MTAEFAIVLPVVVAVLGLVIGAVTLAAHRITLVSLAGEVARLEARGDTDAARVRLANLSAGTEITRDTRAGLHCVELRAAPMSGLLGGITIGAESCAARSGAGAVTAAVANISGAGAGAGAGAGEGSGSSPESSATTRASESAGAHS
ncbi:TadE family type IV pilus minor pilin [Leucobacter luti]|uniref:TadE family type IV pilus minor pilin n=1 Tax=Leucobacter luti TaxID=340320 RepID=UPI001C687CE3|nr:TadE family type IV pilus minor pilin [Leucobacter luti]QYM77102.1 pilus assembly protein [Leucobacter luti]